MFLFLISVYRRKSQPVLTEMTNTEVSINSSNNECDDNFSGALRNTVNTCFSRRHRSLNYFDSRKQVGAHQEPISVRNEMAICVISEFLNCSYGEIHHAGEKCYLFV